MFNHQNATVTLDGVDFPLWFWLLQEPAYSIPEGAIGRLYDPVNGLHTLLYPDRSTGAALPWKEGDRYLSQTATYKAAWAAAQEPPLEVVKTAKIAALSNQCQRDISAGFDSEVLGATHRYSAALEDQLNLMGSALLGVDVPYVCTDGSGVKAARLHTAAQMQQVYAEGAAIKGAKLGKFHALRQQVEAADSIAAVEAIEW